MPIHLLPLLEWGQQTRVDPFFVNSSFCCARALLCGKRRPFRTYPHSNNCHHEERSDVAISAIFLCVLLEAYVYFKEKD